MVEADPLRKYVEAGIAFTQLTKAKAEAMVRELVKAGDVQREQAQDRVDELLDRSRKSTEGLVGLIRRELAQQLSSMGFATKDDVERLDARLDAMAAAAPASAASGSRGSSGSGGETAAEASGEPAAVKAKKAARTAKATPAAKVAKVATATPAAKVAKAAKQTSGVTASPPGTAARTATSKASKAPRRPSGAHG